jgi:hypothetical protein
MLMLLLLLRHWVELVHLRLANVVRRWWLGRMTLWSRRTCTWSSRCDRSAISWAWHSTCTWRTSLTRTSGACMLGAHGTPKLTLIGRASRVHWGSWMGCSRPHHHLTLTNHGPKTCRSCSWLSGHSGPHFFSWCHARRSNEPTSNLVGGHHRRSHSCLHSMDILRNSLA